MGQAAEHHRHLENFIRQVESVQVPWVCPRRGICAVLPAQPLLQPGGRAVCECGYADGMDFLDGKEYVSVLYECSEFAF